LNSHVTKFEPIRPVLYIILYYSMRVIEESVQYVDTRYFIGKSCFVALKGNMLKNYKISCFVALKGNIF